jgi:hypothetical protein
MAQSSSTTTPNQIPVLFTPYQYNRPTEFKPINFKMPINEFTINRTITSNNTKDAVKKTITNP